MVINGARAGVTQTWMTAAKPESKSVSTTFKASHSDQRYCHVLKLFYVTQLTTCKSILGFRILINPTSGS